MNQKFLRLLVVFVGQLCCVLIGVFTGALNTEALRVYSRSERLPVLESPHTAAHIVSNAPLIEHQAMAAEVVRLVGSINSPSLARPIRETNPTLKLTGSAVAQRAPCSSAANASIPMEE